ncbi:MAG: hypothetical protein ACFE9I_02145 [Candidatus Hermodarchaeota archaeon]
MHHLLDFFKETSVNIYDLELVFQKFKSDKAIEEISDSLGNIYNFKTEMDEIFQLIRENREELFYDLKGEYFSNLET